MIHALTVMSSSKNDKLHPQPVAQLDKLKSELLKRWKTVSNQSDLSEEKLDDDVKKMVRLAVEALEYLFLTRDVPRWDFGWIGTQNPNQETLNALYESAPEKIAAKINELKDPVPDLKKIEKKIKKSEELPGLWQKWAIEQKRYFVGIPKGDIEPGIFPEVMDPRNRAKEPGFWIPVFGAGGWTTGPCGSGKHYSRPKS
jgi:hypothetical protein